MSRHRSWRDWWYLGWFHQWLHRDYIISLEVCFALMTHDQREHFRRLRHSDVWSPK